jgi:hypothetical protein
MKLNVTRDECPLCGEADDLQKDIILGRHCYCNACGATWNFESGRVWGRNDDGTLTAKQTIIEKRKQDRRDSAKKYDGLDQRGKL